MLEINSLQPTDVNLRQSLELDADAMAAQFSMDWHWQRIMVNQRPSPAFTRNQRSFIRMFTFVFGVMFYLMRQFERDIAGASAFSHPPSKIRLFNIQTLLKTVQPDGSFSPSITEAGHRDGIRELRALLDVLCAAKDLASDYQFEEMTKHDVKIFVNLLGKRDAINDLLETTKFEFK